MEKERVRGVLESPLVSIGEIAMDFELPAPLRLKTRTELDVAGEDIGTVIWTSGMTTSSLTYFFKSAKDELNRLTVDQFLKLPNYKNVIAAGKLAHKKGNDHYPGLMDCHYAQFEGRWAGHNAINDLFNFPLKEYVQPAYIICIDLGEPSTPYATNGERDMQNKRYEQRTAMNYINSVTMYPWQDAEETVRESVPEIPEF